MLARAVVPPAAAAPEPATAGAPVALPVRGMFSSFELLRIRGVVVAVLLELAVFLPVGIYDSLWARYLQDKGATTVFVGIGLTLYGIPYVLWAPRGGKLADRLGPVRSATLGMLVVVPATAFYGLLAAPVAITALALVEAFGNATAVPGAQTAMARSCPPERLAAGQGLSGSISLLAAGAAAGVAAPVYEAVGSEVLFVGAAVRDGRCWWWPPTCSTAAAGCRACRRAAGPSSACRSCPNRADQRFFTNGSDTTRAGSSVPRTSMTSSSPSTASGGRNARATPWPSSGAKLPLVTSPTATPSSRTTEPSRGGRRPSVTSPRRRRRGPASRSASSTSRPRKGPFSHATTQPRLAWRVVMPGPSSWPWSGKPGLEAQGVAGAQAGGHDAGGGDRGPEGLGVGGGHGQLDAVLAGVAGAGHGEHGVAPGNPGHGEAADGGRRGADRGEALTGVGALHGEHGPLGGDVGGGDLGGAGGRGLLGQRVGDPLRCWRRWA